MRGILRRILGRLGRILRSGLLRRRGLILESAGRGFRSRGFGGLGVDGLARDAGVTSGAFYAHFKSKADAFREAVSVGLGQLANGIEQMRAQLGQHWREGFIDFYLGNRRTCELADSCALQSLSGEVARAGDDVREVFEAELNRIIEAAAAGLEGKSKARRDEATALLAGAAAVRCAGRQISLPQ